MKKGGRQIAKAALVVMSLFVLSRVLGLVRQMVIAAQFGTSDDIDAYVAAARIPEMIFLVVTGGALGSAFIPTFTGHLARGDRAGAWQLASAAINLTLIALSIIAGLSALLAPALVPTILAPGFDDPNKQALTSETLRILLISSVIFGASGIIMSVLNANQHFLLPALASSLYNLAIIGGTLILGPHIGVRGIAVGAVIGSALHLLIQIPILPKYGARYALTLGLKNPSVHEIGRLMVPRMLGTAIVQLNFVINNSLASTMGSGAVSAFDYAFRLLLLPQGVLAQAIGTAAFPTFAEQAACQDWDDMRHTLATTLRTVFFLAIPATVGLLTLGRPLISILFERGRFSQSSTDEVAWTLAFFALGLVGHSGIEIIARAFYALHDTLTPVWVGGLSVGINVLLSLTLPKVFEWASWPPYAGLALANSIATLLETVVLLVLIRRKLGGLEGQETATAFIKSAIAALAMGLIVTGWQTLLPDVGSLAIGASGILLGITTYLGAAWILRTKELKSITRILRRRQ
jgi:putative peptidoglycan lipid II flippase